MLSGISKNVHGRGLPLSDTLKLKGNSYIILGNTTLYIKNDTLIYIPDSVNTQLYNSPTERTKAFYDVLKQEFYKNRITKEIYKLLFSEPAKNVSHQLQSVEESEDPFVAYRNKIIGNIDVRKVNVIGPTVIDTTRQNTSWIAKTANKLHIDTHRKVLLKNLLVEEGDRIDPLFLADNERIIRALPYIRDVRIIVIPREEASDTVDLLLLTQDVWSISFDVRPRGIDAGRLSIDDKNILGFGHELNNSLFYDTDESPVLGYQGAYIVPNIAGTFIVGELNFSETSFQKGIGLKLYRNFFSPAIKYGGGLEISKNKLRNELLVDDSVFVFPTEIEKQDLWLGRAFPLNFGSDFLRERSRIIVAGRVARQYYAIRPEVTADTNRTYHANTLMLGSLGFSNRRYYKDRLIYGFGRTEDIPIGSLFEITAGTQIGEFYNRNYAGLRLTKGGLVDKFGYLYGGINLGGFFRGRKFEQGVLKLESNYFSNLLWIGKYRIRQFVNLNYIDGIRRFSDEFIDLRDENGIRGLRSNFLRGNKKLTAQIETVAFTPLYLLGFRFAFFAFADLGVVQVGDKSLFKGDFYQGYGLGVRIRNDNLTFNTFQFRLGWYPTVPRDGSAFYFNISGEPILRLDDFDIKAPNVLPYE